MLPIIELLNFLSVTCIRSYTFIFSFSKDERQQDYVIEIRILPQPASFRVTTNGEYKIQLSQVHVNEEGKCYFRKSASCVEVIIKDKRKNVIKSFQYSVMLKTSKSLSF